MDEKIDIKIEQYIQGELSPENQAEFEQAMAQDSELAAEVALQQDIEAAISEPEVAELEQKLAYLMRERSPAKIILPSGWRKWAVAASVVLIVGLGYLLLRESHQSRTPEELYLAYAELPSDLQLSSGIRSDPSGQESDPGISVWKVVDSLYQAKEYGLAEEKLQTWLVQHPDPQANQTAIYYYYLGMVQLQMEQFSAAQHSLRKVRSGPYAESANWYVGLADLRTNGTSPEVKKSIEQFLRYENPYREKAKAILDGWPEE
ncbi:MAG: hypothetical protein AAF927_02200 [Bacteroidota bacterium]